MAAAMLALALLLLAPVGATGEEAKNVAVVLKTTGTVEFQRSGESPWAEAVRGLVLGSGDKLRTGRHSEVAALFVDDRSLLKLSEETEVTFHATREGRSVSKRVWMGAGNLWAKVTKADTPHFQVETPTSVASVKGSEFYSREQKEIGNTLHAISGFYGYSNEFGEIELIAGQTGLSSGQAPPTSRQTQGGEVPDFGGGIDGFGDRGAGGSGVGDEGAAPGNLRAEANSASEILVSWVDGFNDETGYELERQLEDAWLPLVTVGAGVDNYADGELAAGTQYCYRVRAIAGAAASDWSAVGCDSTLTPMDPSNLVVQATAIREITLTWRDNAEGETGYEISRSVDGGPMEPLATLDPDVVRYRDVNVVGISRYCYRVRALFEAEPSQFTRTKCATAMDDGVIDATEKVIRVEMIDENGNRRVIVIPLIKPE